MHRNIFTITLGIALLVFGFFGEQIIGLFGELPTIVSANPRLALRSALIAGGILLLFPELLLPIIRFVKWFIRGFYETMNRLEAVKRERAILNYLKQSKKRNKVALEKVRMELASS